MAKKPTSRKRAGRTISSRANRTRSASTARSRGATLGSLLPLTEVRSRSPGIGNIPQPDVGRIVQSYLDRDGILILDVRNDGPNTFSVIPRG